MLPTEIPIAESVKPYQIPLDVLAAQYPGKRLVVGIAIIARCDRGTTSAKGVLLLQRSATEDSFPSMYEIPGGGAEPGVDETLIDTIIRETMEETGLTVTRVLGTFKGFEYETSSGKAVQFNFVVEIKGGMGCTEEIEVKLNPEEHQAFVWIGEQDDLGNYPVTGSMKVVVEDALRVAQLI